MKKPVQDENTTKWVFLLSKFDIKYVTQKSMKRRAVVDHLAYCSLGEAEEIQRDFSDEDIMGLKWNHGRCILMEQQIKTKVELEFS